MSGIGIGNLVASPAVAVETSEQPEHSLLRRWSVWGLPIAFTIIWVVFVFTAGHLDRVVDNWRSSTTMLFGSFVAGSTPQGGGAVAFPVFTKVIGINAPVARTFSVAIQATGMVMASLSILLAGRKIDVKALALGTIGGSVGFLIGLFVLSNPDTTFWAPRIEPAFIKVAFTVIIFSVALIVRLCAKGAGKLPAVEKWGVRSIPLMLAFAIIGGMFSGLTGSGTDVFLFVFVVLVAGVSPKVAIPTSIIAMACVSVLGFLILGIWHGQLDIALDPTGTEVVGVGGAAFGPESAVQFYLFGIWLAAAPIVVWGAPLGAWLAAKVSEKTVIRFVGFIALAEVATTIIFLDDLRTNPVLTATFVVGLIAAYFGVNALDKLAAWIMVDEPESEPQPVKAG